MTMLALIEPCSAGPKDATREEFGERQRASEPIRSIQHVVDNFVRAISGEAETSDAQPFCEEENAYWAR
jgi:hypothetical protein